MCTKASMLVPGLQLVVIIWESIVLMFSSGSNSKTNLIGQHSSIINCSCCDNQNLTVFQTEYWNMTLTAKSSSLLPVVWVCLNS